MSRIRSALALAALGLFFAVAGHAQTNPAVSTIVAFSLSNPVGNLVQGADGALYGVASPATSITGGVIYRTTLDGSDVRTLYQLKPDDALSPAGGLVLASDGLLYGTTKFGQAGQIDGAGSIFRIAASGTGFQIIHRFAPITTSNQDGSPVNTNGAYPEAELVEGADGYLYGTSTRGWSERHRDHLQDFARRHRFQVAVQFRRGHLGRRLRPHRDGGRCSADGSVRRGHRQLPVRHDVAGRHEWPWQRSTALRSTARVSRSCITSARPLSTPRRGYSRTRTVQRRWAAWSMAATASSTG